MTEKRDRTDTSGQERTVGSVYARFERRFAAICREYAYLAIRVSLGIVFIWYGAQKPFIPGRSPIHRPVAMFAETLGLGILPGPTGLLLHFVGLFEVVVGTLILFDFVRTATPLFLLHQAITLVAPFVVLQYAFRAPYLEIGPVVIPIAVDWFSAFALKNLVFVAAFMFLFARHRDRSTHTSPSAKGR